MVGACEDMLNFTDEPSRRINAEYLFTVNVAKAINRLNSYHGDPYRIFLEKSTKHFARDCLKPVVFGHPLERRSTVFRKDTLRIERNGRIDIAVYTDVSNNGYMGEQPLCAIELKGFNPQRKLVINDLKRNLAYLRVSGNTGSSVLGFSLFAALHDFDKHDSEAHVQENEAQVHNLYKVWLAQLGNMSDIKASIEAFTVRKELLGRVTDEGEYEVLDSAARHHFVGVIVCFAPRESN